MVVFTWMHIISNCFTPVLRYLAVDWSIDGDPNKTVDDV